MDLNDLKNRTTAELQELLLEKRAELHNLNAKARTRQLKQVHTVPAARQTIARIMTLLAERQRAK
ncbi:MAG TPA: 50S ribosomal protein L29 [Patescibacteria group bacterium]|nr:50S ribosomal protein L29 [Patescibacteria group bacterium]